MARLLWLASAFASVGALITPRGNGIVTMPMHRDRPIDAPPQPIAGSSQTLTRTNLTQYEGALYSVEVEIGSPPQTVNVQFDTASNEFWVNPSCASVNQAVRDVCYSSGHYYPNVSTTGTRISNRTWQIVYGQGRAWGYYYQDDISFSGAHLKNTQFGVAQYSAYVYNGIMGMGFGKGLNTVYNTVLDQLYELRYIQERQFSMGLGSIDTEAGELIFGAIDQKKYTGTLRESKIIFPGPDQVYRYWINMTTFGSTQPTTCEERNYLNGTIPVVLDSGSTMSYLPQSVLTAVVADFPDAIYDPTNGGWLVGCDNVDRQATFDFTFGDAKIQVPYKEFIWQVDGICFLGISPALRSSRGEVSILGDNFLRAAYVVINQDRQSIYLAQGADCGSELVPFSNTSLAHPGLCQPAAPLCQPSGGYGFPAPPPPLGPTGKTSTEDEGTTTIHITSTGRTTIHVTASKSTITMPIATFTNSTSTLSPSDSGQYSNSTTTVYVTATETATHQAVDVVTVTRYVTATTGAQG